MVRKISLFVLTSIVILLLSSCGIVGNEDYYSGAGSDNDSVFHDDYDGYYSGARSDSHDVSPGAHEGY